MPALGPAPAPGFHTEESSLSEQTKRIQTARDLWLYAERIQTTERFLSWLSSELSESFGTVAPAQTLMLMATTRLMTAANREAGRWHRRQIRTGQPSVALYDERIGRSWHTIAEAFRTMNCRPDMHSLGLPARSMLIQTAQLSLAHARIVERLGAEDRQAYARDPVRLNRACSMAAEDLAGAVNLLMHLADELYGVPRTDAEAIMDG